MQPVSDQEASVLIAEYKTARAEYVRRQNALINPQKRFTRAQEALRTAHESLLSHGIEVPK